MANNNQHSQNILWGVSLIVAPGLLTLSTFFWQNGHYGVTGGSIIVVDMLFWIISFTALFNMVKAKMPLYAVWGLPVAVLGCVAGANFGFADYYAQVFGISHATYIHTMARYPVSANLLLFQTGPLMPLSLFVLGLVFIRTHTIQKWAAFLICLGAVMFPVSRILRDESLAHVCDALLLLPLAYTGIKMLPCASRLAQANANMQ